MTGERTGEVAIDNEWGESDNNITMKDNREILPDVPLSMVISKHPSGRGQRQPVSFIVKHKKVVSKNVVHSVAAVSSI